jgi:ubiquinone/menaquinone biosynthesis C-methylase UbiE
MSGWQTDQAAVTRVYERVAAFYDAYDGAMDLMGGAERRRRVVGRARGATLEVGIGTGRNLDHYPPGTALTGIDVSGRMLERARERALRLGRSVRLLEADVHALPFDDGAFDTVVATCVFCSVADPQRGLAEARRVVKPDGVVLLLEHVRPVNALLGGLADMVTPLSRRLFGPEMNRHFEATVASARLDVLEMRREGIWREMVCRPSSAAGTPEIDAPATSTTDLWNDSGT